MSREVKRVLVYRLGSLGDTESGGVNRALSGVFDNTPIIVASIGTKNQSNDWEAANWLRLFDQLKSVVGCSFSFNSNGFLFGLRIVDVKGHA